MVDETVSAAVETVGPINTVDPISEAMEIVETAEPETGDPRCRTRSMHRMPEPAREGLDSED